MNVIIADSDFLNKGLYLAHHGVEGQKHGVRNGPPYPLDRQGKAALRKQRKANKKAAKVAKKQEARKVAAEKKEAALKENKRKIIMSGSATEVLKYKGMWTNDELQAITRRLDLERQLSQASAREIKTGMDKLEEMSKTVGRLTNVANQGIKTYNAIAAIYNATQKNDESKSLPLVNTKGGGGGGKKDKDKDKK